MVCISEPIKSLRGILKMKTKNVLTNENKEMAKKEKLERARAKRLKDLEEYKRICEMKIAFEIIPIRKHNIKGIIE